MNKKGDIAVVVLVFLIVILLVSSLFVFSFKSAEIKNTSLYSVFKSKSNSGVVEQSISIASQRALLKTFYEFSLGKNYDYINAKKSTNEFFILHIKLNESFSLRFKENLLEEISLHNLSSNNSKFYFDDFKKGKFDVSFDGDKIELKFNYSSLFSGNIFNVNYSEEIKVNYSLNELELNNFKEIYLAKETCKNLDYLDMKTCYEASLSHFDVELVLESEGAQRFGITKIDSEKDLFIVHLISKDSFYFDGEKKNIEFVFVGK